MNHIKYRTLGRSLIFTILKMAVNLKTFGQNTNNTTRMSSCYTGHITPVGVAATYRDNLSKN